MSVLYSFDDSLWPLLITRVAGVMSDKQFEAFLSESSTFLRRGERYVSITDLVHVGLPSAEQRRMQADWIREYETALRTQVLGNANVVTSTPVRLALSLVFHIKPLPMPYVLVPDMRSATTWVTARLEDGGLIAEARHIRHQLGLPAIRAG
jgi:hypothetical protein